jgi:MoxR-like ATPase
MAARARRSSGRARRPSLVARKRGAGFLERLGLVGYGALEPVLLGALALEAPVLLVGAHGTAKSLLVERVAGALGLAFRHYNAALLSYDDLVGIPMPDERGESLRFVGTPGAIWGAGFAFFDEISRCRPDLQNKLFPVIHERRVAGVELPDLKLRWAAMNPPAGDDDEAESTASLYLGSEILDPALADRFPFVVTVPGWRELAKEDRLRLVIGGVGEEPAQASAKGKARKSTASGPPDLAELVERCRGELAKVEARMGARIAEYVVQLVELLGQAGVPQSPRRARMLARSVAAVHAARRVLEGPKVDPEASADLAVRHGLPQTAEPEAPPPVKVLAAHRQAWDVAGLADDDVWREILAEPDPVERVLVGDRLGLVDAELGRLVTRALAEEPCDARRIGLATAMTLGLRGRRRLSPAAWEALARLARRVLEPALREDKLAPGPLLECWRKLQAYLAAADPERPGAELERSFLVGGFPDLWRSTPWREALEQLQADLARFDALAEEAR